MMPNSHCIWLKFMILILYSAPGNWKQHWPEQEMSKQTLQGLFPAQIISNTKSPLEKNQEVTSKRFIQQMKMMIALLESLNLPHETPACLPTQGPDAHLRSTSTTWHNGVFLAEIRQFSFFLRTARHFCKVRKIAKHLVLPSAFSCSLTFKQVWHVGLQNLLWNIQIWHKVLGFWWIASLEHGSTQS